MTDTSDERIARTQHLWSIGSYAPIGDLFIEVGKSLADELDSLVGLAGKDVLDVATGTGNTAVAFARHGARVVGSDITPVLLEEAGHRAAAAGLDINFELGDFMSLPYDDSSFDLVSSTFGVMFAPDPNRAAAELTRVCADNGVIAMTAWTRDGWFGQSNQIMVRFNPRLADDPGPDSASWAEPDHLLKYFEGTSAVLADVTILEIPARFHSVESAFRFFEQNSGPFQMGEAAVRELGGDWTATRAAVIHAWQEMSRPVENGVEMPLRYGRALLRKRE